MFALIANILDIVKTTPQINFYMPFFIINIIELKGNLRVVCVDMNLYGSLYTLMSRYRKAVIHIYVDTFHIRYYFLSFAFV